MQNKSNSNSDILYDIENKTINDSLMNARNILNLNTDKVDYTIDSTSSNSSSDTSTDNSLNTSNESTNPTDNPTDKSNKISSHLSTSSLPDLSQETPIYPNLEIMKQHINIKLQNIAYSSLYPIDELAKRHIEQSKIDLFIHKDIIAILNRYVKNNNIDISNILSNLPNDNINIINLDNGVNIINTNNVSIYKTERINVQSIVNKIDCLAYMYDYVFIIRSSYQNPIDETFYIICLKRNEQSIKSNNSIALESNISNIIDIYCMFLSRLDNLLNLIIKLDTNEASNDILGIEITPKYEYLQYVRYLKAMVDSIMK